MQDIKRLVEQGKVELARIGDNNQPVKMDYSELQLKRDRLNKMEFTLLSLKDLTSEQRCLWVVEQKTKANELYRLQKYQQALQVYLQALAGIDRGDTDAARLRQAKQRLQYPIMLNMCSCFYRMREFGRGLSLCERVLEEPEGKDNQLAWYRKAGFLLELGRYQEAREIVRRLREKNQKINDSKKNVEKVISNADIQDLVQRIKKKTKQEKNVYQKMLRSTEQQQESGFLMSSNTKQKQTEKHPSNKTRTICNCLKYVLSKIKLI